MKALCLGLIAIATFLAFFYIGKMSQNGINPHDCAFLGLNIFTVVVNIYNIKRMDN